MHWLFLALAGLLLAEPAYADPIVIAHRGRDATTHENTLAAFRRSIALGVTILETDVRPTKDGQLVLLHDATVDRTTNGHGWIGDLTLAQVQALDAGSGEHVPTLSEALRLVRGTGIRLMLDMKPGTPVGDVLRLMRADRAERNVIFGLRSPRQALELRRLAPEIPAVALMKRFRDFDAFEKAGVHIIRLWSDWIDPALGGDPKLVGTVKTRGHAAWCIVGKRLPRSDSEWQSAHARLIALGIDAIATDRPDLVRLADESVANGSHYRL
jgi:glycerophosphoryl diester phosphodiesterase